MSPRLESVPSIPAAPTGRFTRRVTLEDALGVDHGPLHAQTVALTQAFETRTPAPSPVGEKSFTRRQHEVGGDSGFASVGLGRGQLPVPGPRAHRVPRRRRAAARSGRLA